MNEYYTDINAKALDQWVSKGWEWGRAISHQEYLKAKNGDWNVVLTPQIKVPHEWFAPFINENRLQGVQLLGLASGGGQQIPIFQALGADTTVLDYSESQLNNERIVAEREGYRINIVKADMSKMLPFKDEMFDIIFHPVSNCYVEDVYHVWKECYRILKPGGILLAGMDNGFSYLFDEEEAPLTVQNKLPYNPLKDPKVLEHSLKLDGSIQFSHSLEAQLDGQMQAGFRLTNLKEDRDKDSLLSEYFPQYILTRAVKQ